MKYGILTLGLIGFIFVFASFVSGQNLIKPQNICCEQTTTGFFCQNVPLSECKNDARQVPTSCESTSYCKAGYCFNPKEGTCMDNTPEIVCGASGGIWSAQQPPQCNLGCCVLGDQAAFVTLTRCKKLSAELGLKTNYRKDIVEEQSCILSVAGQEKGACVFDFEYEKTCKFTTRAECAAEEDSSKEFFPGKLCTSEELNTNCGPTERTMCIPGKEEVYFVDTCGNPANIYDSSKSDDKEYWNDFKTKSQSCSSQSANAESKTCGNCNYLLGSFCRDVEYSGTKPIYGTNICADLNCVDDEGKNRLHGESWCEYSDKGKVDSSDNAVGSRYFKKICNNGKVQTEACETFRNEICIEDDINGFLQAACRVNRWQDCILQEEEQDCENTDKRDCVWKQGTFNTVLSASQEDEKNPIKTREGLCLPLNSPGLKFWEGESAQQTCSLGNAQCIVKFEKGLFGGDEECIENCECLSESWKKNHAEICSALGDCGAKINWIGQKGYKLGYNVSIK